MLVWAVGRNYCIRILCFAVSVFRVGSWTKIDLSTRSSGWLGVLNTASVSHCTLMRTLQMYGTIVFKCQSLSFLKCASQISVASADDKTNFYQLCLCQRIFNPLPLSSASLPSSHLPFLPSVLAFTCSLQQHLAPASPACLLNFSLFSHFGSFPQPSVVEGKKRETTLRAYRSQRNQPF